jgi:hypothetical protein
MQAVPRVLKALRFDPREVLAEAGVDARLFEDADNLIRDELVGRLLRHCVARTGCEDFALRVGRHSRLASLGLVGAVAGSALDVTTASLDAPELFPPRDHVWTSHAIPWLELGDDLPRHAKFRPET